MIRRSQTLTDKDAEDGRPVHNNQHIGADTGAPPEGNVILPHRSCALPNDAVCASRRGFCLRLLDATGDRMLIYPP